MQKTKLPNIISILVLTLITSVMWISLSIYRSLTSEASPSVPSEISDPIKPNLDSETLNDINSKIFLDDSQVPNIKINATPAPTLIPKVTTAPSPTPIETPISSTESAIPTP